LRVFLIHLYMKRDCFYCHIKFVNAQSVKREMKDAEIDIQIIDWPNGSQSNIATQPIPNTNGHNTEYKFQPSGQRFFTKKDRS